MPKRTHLLNVALVILAFITFQILAGWEQVEELVRWKSANEPYAMAVLSRRSRLGFMGSNKRHQIVVGNDQSLFDHGHLRDFSFDDLNLDPDYLKRCRAQWGPEGVALLEPSGHRFFIPRSAYAHGR